MKKFLSIILITIILSMTIPAHAGDWEFEFFGINAKDFKGRKALPIIVGCITSFVVHEAGHLIVGRMVGMDVRVKGHGRDIKIWDDNYDDKTDYEKSLFNGGGFLAQALVGTALTAIPYTRHSDFSLGFTGFTMVNNIAYGIVDEIEDDDISDVKQLNDHGYNGKMIAIGSGLLSGVYTYINLNKHQEKIEVAVN